MSHRSERGSMSVELVLLTPVFIALLLLVVALGRLQAARAYVAAAARGAGRAGSTERAAPPARRSGERTARAALADRDDPCSAVVVEVDTDGFAPGGSVTVSISCTVGLGDVTGLAIPARHTYTTRFTEPVDRFRGTR